MFLGRKNQYCENDYTTKCNLQIQCDPYQIANGIFHRTRTKYLKICMKTQKTLNSQRNMQTMNTGEGVEKREPAYTVGGNVNSYSHNGEQ